MKSYLQLAPKYLSAHKKRSRLAMISVIIAVALVAGIFSILDALVAFERQNILNTEGNYHILIRNPSGDEIEQIQSRFDVLNSGMLKEFNNGTIQNEECALGAIDINFAANLNFKIEDGSYPEADNEVMLEQWYMSKAGLHIGDKVTITPQAKAPKEYIISGIYKDWGVTKANSFPIVFISMKAASTLSPENSSYFILFKDGIKIKQAENNIKTSLKIPGDRIARNEGLLALMLQTSDNRVLQFYAIGVALFALVLITAVVMIYNTFNISVMERVKQFGLLRCIGSSKHQVKRLVRREGMLIAVKAIPFGLVLGFLMSVVCLGVLRIFNNNIYGKIALLHVSPIGLLAGIILGFMTVLLALLSPAKKASKVSPVNALTCNSEIKVSKKKKAGLLTKLFPVEIAMGITNATQKRKTLFLMACSIALSIIMFLLFQSLINPDVLGVRPIQPYTADIRLTGAEGISQDVFETLQKFDGVEKVNGRMSTFINASINEQRLTSYYKNEVKGLKTDKDDYLTNPEKSWLISYDTTQLKWAKSYLEEGSLNEDYLNKNQGVIVVNKIYRDNSLSKTTSLKLGDTVRIKIKHGTIIFTVLGTVDSIPYSTDETSMTTFITTEKLFRKISNETAYKTIDVQLRKQNQDATVNQIKKLAGATLKVGDRRQMNKEASNAYMTVTIFIYGFVSVIAFISILNNINTMNTSVAAKMRKFGIMRAIGLSGNQLSRMVITEALTFCLTGCLLGCILGVFLQMKFVEFLLASWSFPIMQVIVIFLVCLSTSFISVLGPLKQIKEKGISDVINTL